MTWYLLRPRPISNGMEPLAKLIGSPGRLKLLRLFLFNQDAAFTLAEAGERAKLTREVTRDECAILVASGVIRKKGTGVKAKYQTDKRFEYFGALDTFIRTTTAVQPATVLALVKKAGTLRLLVLSGIFTGSIEPQIDLLVVGDNLDERALARAVHVIEAELGREVRYASFSTEDFRYRRGVYDRLIRDVLDYPHQVVFDRIGL